MNAVVGLPAPLADIDRCLVMGILNVTPDSFSDGGSFLDREAALTHAQALVRDGADIVDVGGESTRPGARRVPAEEEQRRVLPVVRALADKGILVSIDTMRAETAQLALEAGAVIVNDVSGGQADSAMPDVVAAARVPYIAMHWRGHSADMHTRATYDDVVTEVVDELRSRLTALEAGGVDPGQVVLDPGLGFAKDSGHNWTLLAHLDSLLALGRPLLVGASRKRFLESVSGPDSRDHATTAVTALAAAAGAWGVRVHDVRGSRNAVRVVAAVRTAAGDRALA